MNRRKGFTLIELIAVLVILAVVSLIVAPLILNTIRKVKDSVNMRSVDGYGRAVEYAMANYQLKHLKYPDNFDELEIEYHGNKVECDVSRINPDYSIYLSGCKVNGKYVKSDKNKDGYYHFGALKMTNQEYVDTYGNNLEDAIKKYHDEHNEYPSDYTILTVPLLDKEVSCSVETYSDGKVYLTKCSINNEEVLDSSSDDGYYQYGKKYPIATEYLVNKANGIDIVAYTDGNIHEMYTFNHASTQQTPALTDYRYIGNDPNNYVKFNSGEMWRIIGVFEVDDGTENYEKRVKLIRNDSIGGKSWNSTNVNEWVNSSIQDFLNNTYLPNIDSKNMIDNVKWYLCGIVNHATSSGETFYNSERGTAVSNADRSKNWIGKIGLMYPSDYGFTYALGVDTTCFNRLANCNNGVPTSGWLYRSESTQWTITPNSMYTNHVFFYDSSGWVQYNYVRTSYETLPVLYLKSNVKIKSGDGTSLSPYEFEL